MNTSIASYSEHKQATRRSSDANTNNVATITIWQPGDTYSPKPWHYTLANIKQLIEKYPRIQIALDKNIYTPEYICDETYKHDMDLWHKAQTHGFNSLCPQEAHPYNSLRFGNKTPKYNDWGLQISPQGYLPDFDYVRPLLEHSNRTAWHVSLTRDFAKSYKKIICDTCKDWASANNETPVHQTWCDDPTCGTSKKKYAYTDIDWTGQHKHKTQIHHHRYAVLNAPTVKKFIIIDIDNIPGLNPTYTPHTALTLKNTLHPHIYTKITALAKHHGAPSYVGINMESGHTQLIWMICDVYKNSNQQSKPLDLYKTTVQHLENYFDADTHFTGGFSRNPLYSKQGEYQWFYLHSHIFNLLNIDWALYKTTGQTHDSGTSYLPSARLHSNTRDLINYVNNPTTNNTTTLQHYNLTTLQPNNLTTLLHTLGIHTITNIYPARNNSRNTSTFNLCMRAATELYTTGRIITDTIIEQIWHAAYNHFCTTFHNHTNKDTYDPNLPSRIRRYITQPGTTYHEKPDGTVRRQLTQKDKQKLSNAGKKGAHTTNTRRWANPNENNTHILTARNNALNALTRANNTRKQQAQYTALRIKNLILANLKNGIWPLTRNIAHQLALNPKTVDRHRKQLTLTATDIQTKIHTGELTYTPQPPQTTQSSHRRHITVGGEGHPSLPTKPQTINSTNQRKTRHTPNPPPQQE